MTRARIALFGGTFDPVHWGHLLLAESARTTHRLDRILFVPAGIPPHKAPPAASAAHRLRMLHMATADNPSFEVDNWEVRQKRVVYSFETIAHFRWRWPDARLFFIVGTDMLKSIDVWKKGRELLGQCNFLAAERPGIPWAHLSSRLRHKTHRIVWPSVPLASHEIRAAVRRGNSIRYQVPDAVERYIRRHRLYR
jgi:nicotinate-nucleotide adenylyltransferase